MSLAFHEGHVAIRRLGVRLDARAFDPLAAHLHLQRLLGALSPQLPRLPPAAILCIRRLPDPLPGALRLRSQEVRPSAEWERALLDTLDDQARRAARPALGPTPASAEAVLFADRAEMLACLAEDLLAGRAVENWWWRSLIGAVELRRAASQAFAATPEHVPAALEKLTRAAEYVARLDDMEARHWLSLICERFGVPLPSAPSQAPVASGGWLAPAVDEGAKSAAHAERGAPPWNPWIAAHEIVTLHGERQALLVIALLLRRAPNLIRSAVFAARIARALWSSDPAATAPTAATAGDLGTERLATISRGSPTHESRSGAPEAIDPVAQQAGPVDTSIEIGDPQPGPAVAVPRSVQFAPTMLSDAGEAVPSTPVLAALPTVAPASARESGGAAEHLDATPTTQVSAKVEPASLARRFGAALDTELGGLFHLVNVALRLGLYPDFTRPADPGLALPIWDFVGLFGAGLLGEVDGVDPVWTLLAELAGRPADEPPHARFEPPVEWRVPADWLAAFPPTDAWRERLAACHEGSFTERLLAFLRAYLSLALGLESANEIAPLLIRRRARVHTTAVHIDVVFALAELPIVVRLAGLDRDVGWLPSAGRYLTFHFE